MTKFNLTEKEMTVAKILVQTCLDNMGGNRPADLEFDEYTWICVGDLTEKGYSHHEAAGFFSSLEAKGFIFEADTDQMVVATSAWQWMDTVWDATETAVA